MNYNPRTYTEKVIRETQRKAILRHLKKTKYLDSLQALEKFGCFKLATRIWELKNHAPRNNIKSVWFQSTVSGKYFVKYTLEKKKAKKVTKKKSKQTK